MYQVLDTRDVASGFVLVVILDGMFPIMSIIRKINGEPFYIALCVMDSYRMYPMLTNSSSGTITHVFVLLMKRLTNVASICSIAQST